MKYVNQLLEDRGMYNGQIFTPQSFQERFGGKALSTLTGEGYGLTGYISAEMRKQIHEKPKGIGWRLTMYETKTRQRYFVVIAQCGRSQTRFVMHPADPLVQQLVRWSGENGFLQMFLGVSGEQEVSYLQTEFRPKDVQGLSTLGDEAQRKFDIGLMGDMAAAAVELKGGIGLLDCPGMAPADEVVVNSILWFDELSQRRAVAPESELVFL